MYKGSQVSQHFWRSEFACKCGCGFDTVDAELINVLEYLRFQLNTPIIVTSGCRCEAYNAKIGGSPRSQHLKGKAADIKASGIRAINVANAIEVHYRTQYGMGRYDGRTHIDVREKKSRWDLRK